MWEFNQKEFEEYCDRQNCKDCKLNRENISCRKLAEVYKKITYTGNGINYVKALLEMIYDIQALKQYQKYCVDKAISELLDAEQ